MRFMVFVPASPESEAGVMPTTDQLAEMTSYNEELVKAGVMLAGDGLQPTSKGAKRPLQRRHEHRHRRSLHRGQGDRRGLLGLGVLLARGGA